MVAGRFGIGLGALVCVLVGVSAAASAETYIWVDEAGTTHVTDDPAAMPKDVEKAAPEGEIDSLRALWPEGPVGSSSVGGLSAGSNRVRRLLTGAARDLDRGEAARAAATLRSVLRLDPANPHAHWLLAQQARGRGRYDEEENHLRSVVSGAGDRFAGIRTRASDRLSELEREQQLADAERLGPLELVDIESPHFRLRVDSDLDDGRARYAATAVQFLEAAYSDVSDQLGVVPSEPIGVVFYGRAAYTRAHRHRFSFQTVGFFDGVIHVSSPAFPAKGLRGLLYHEYTHALFREQTGGDRPYWLNEGLAELIERRSLERPTSTRSERSSLNVRIVAGDWIPLRTLAPSFGGLSDEDARAAYLQSIVTAEWIEAHTNAEERARLLARLGGGFSVDQALFELFGFDTDGLDRVVQRDLSAEFPSLGAVRR